LLLRLINGNIDGITIIGLVTAGNKASPTAKTRQGSGRGSHLGLCFPEDASHHIRRCLVGAWCA